MDYWFKCLLNIFSFTVCQKELFLHQTPFFFHVILISVIDWYFISCLDSNYRYMNPSFVFFFNPLSMYKQISSMYKQISILHLKYMQNMPTPLLPSFYFKSPLSFFKPRLKKHPPNWSWASVMVSLQTVLIKNLSHSEWKPQSW